MLLVLKNTNATFFSGRRKYYNNLNILITFITIDNLVRVDPVHSFKVPGSTLRLSCILLLSAFHPEMPVKMLRVCDHVGWWVPQATVLALEGRRVVQHIDEGRLTPEDNNQRFVDHIYHSVQNRIYLKCVVIKLNFTKINVLLAQ